MIQKESRQKSPKKRCKFGKCVRMPPIENGGLPPRCAWRSWALGMAAACIRFLAAVMALVSSVSLLCICYTFQFIPATSGPRKPVLSLGIDEPKRIACQKHLPFREAAFLFWKARQKSPKSTNPPHVIHKILIFHSQNPLMVVKSSSLGRLLPEGSLGHYKRRKSYKN